MKVSVKLSVFSIAVTLALLIFTIIVRNITAKDYIMSNDRSLNESSVKSEAAVMEMVFDDIGNSIRTVSSNNVIIDFVQNKNDPRLYSEVSELIDIFSRSEGLVNLSVSDINGICIASSDDSLIGSPFAFSDIQTDESSGISVLFMYDEETPAFMVTRQIYSHNSKVIGTITAVYGTDKPVKVIEAVSSDSASSFMIMDGAGNIINGSTGRFMHYTSFGEYAETGPAFSFSNITDEAPLYSAEYTYQKKDKYISVNKISNTPWYAIASTRLDKNYHSLLKSFHLPIIEFVIAAVLLSAAVMYLLQPLDKMIDYIKERIKGTNPPKLITKNDEFGKINELLNIYTDKLSSSEQLYRTISEMSDNIIFEIDFISRKLITSVNFNSIFSFRAKDDSIKESFIYKLKIHKDDRAAFIADAEALLGGGEKWLGEYRLMNRYGSFTWIKIKAQALRDRNNKIFKAVGVMLDIDKEKEAELNLIRKASFDALTRIYNREAFLKRLDNEFESSAARSSLDAVMFVDLDDFKHFNDKYGHSCGDEVLKFTADTIKELTYDHGFGGRYGGDEFIICFTDIKLIGDAGSLAAEMIEILGKGFISETTGENISIKCSIGIAFFRENGSTPDEVIAAADNAMYKIKKHGKSNFSYASASDSETNEEALSRLGKPIDSDIENKANE